MKILLLALLTTFNVACSQSKVKDYERHPSSPIDSKRVNATNDFKDDLYESLSPLLNKTISCDGDKVLTIATRNPNRYIAFHFDSKNNQGFQRTLRVFTLPLWNYVVKENVTTVVFGADLDNEPRSPFPKSMSDTEIMMFQRNEKGEIVSIAIQTTMAADEKSIFTCKIINVSPIKF